HALSCADGPTLFFNPFVGNDHPIQPAGPSPRHGASPAVEARLPRFVVPFLARRGGPPVPLGNRVGVFGVSRPPAAFEEGKPCRTKDPGLRRMGEDTTAANMKGAQAIPSYQILGDMDLKDREAVKAKLHEAGVQAVLVMRMTGVTEQTTAVGGPYGTFDGYYDY